MNFTTTRFVPLRRMGICEPMVHQMDEWQNDLPITSSLPMPLEEVDANKLDNQSSDTSRATACTNRDKYEPESVKPNEKVLRRLAQNREAARKSRLRKKAYVQQLEKSRLRLIQLEQELNRVKRQGLYAGTALNSNLLGSSGTLNPEIATFEMEYGHWVKSQDRQVSELSNALCSDQMGVTDLILRVHVNNAMKHYFELFTMKAKAAKTDVFYLISGMWKTPTERFFLWIGGFRPSELLKILLPHLEDNSTLSEKQRLDVFNLMQSCQQAEEALSQGLVKLHFVLAETVTDDQLGEGHNYLPRLGCVMEKFEALVRFVVQADHLRQVTLQQMSHILTIRQTAQGLLVLGEYMKRLRALSSCWSTRPREPA